MANVLVTGGTGLLGGPTVKRLLSLGHKVVAYDLVPNLDNLGEARDEVEVVRGDIADLPNLMRVIKRSKITHVIHLAAFIKHQSIADPLGAVMANCAATAYLCELALTLDVERIVWASTAGVYGKRDRYPDGARVNEDDLVGPSSPYGATKVACEQLAQAYHDNSGLDVVGFRLAYVYGLGRLTGATGQFNDMLRQLALGQPATFPALAGGPSSLWQPMFNEDMAQVFCEATFGPKADRTIYNAPVNQTLTVEESMAILRDLIPGAQVELSKDAVGLGTVPLMDGTNAQNMFKVPLKHDLKAGWAKMLEQYRK
ncbi:SDR family oxidoreductase [Sphingobium sp.]|uniref:NAD-dependent epimerase/dehydratase family protein n=1 Tax=Sphingobium sp. TaxID=1912891 RepID=UPI002B93DE60|nr:SDR family oxidoreductase [Sphingobium sp.]HUD90708.1 SDR family oxidoreductase [Sphingobium sp.]